MDPGLQREIDHVAGTILVIILIFPARGFSGRFGGYASVVILIILVVLLLMGRI
jgi:hypothetical protein